METVEASTLVYLPPEEIYEFLVDFQQYGKYTKYVTNIDREGEDDAGAVYDITVSWWKIDYTARSKVTDVDPPNRIDWELPKASMHTATGRSNTSQTKHQTTNRTPAGYGVSRSSIRTRWTVIRSTFPDSSAIK
ncbi:SRPBCC family protein [Halocatena marina]